MDKPTKPTDLMPRSFGGLKANWSASMQETGYEPAVPAIYSGSNLNYQIDATGKELDYCEKICDFINNIPIGKTITVDSNNKLVYDDLAQSVPIATTSTAGIVKPDGTTIGVQNDGTISVTGGVLPSQTGNAGKVLTTDGTDASWGATAQVYPVVETYINGNSWYKIYAPDSTGYRWCEQGGCNTFAGSGTQVAFLKAFTDTNYTITLGHYSGNATYYSTGVSIVSVSDTSFTANGWQTNTVGSWDAYWQASGYIVDEV